MKARAVAVFLLLAASASGAGAQALTERQVLGQRLFNQSCRVCHVKPQMTSAQYAPVLTRASLGGNDDALRAFIANGSPQKMPGFRYHFTSAEIDAIVAYLKAIP